MKLRLSLDRVANVAVIAAAVTFIALSVRGYFRWNFASEREQRRPGPTGQAPTAAIEPVGDLSVNNIDQATTRSSSKPKVALIDFSDFQCPYCARYARETYPEIRREFVESGQVKYVFFNLPLEQLHPLALHASEAAECAGRQEKFWDMHDRLFKARATLSEAAFVAEANTLGLRVPDFESCLAGATLPRIRTQMAEAARSGVTSTPTFLIGRIESPQSVRVLYRMRGAQPYSNFARALKDALASKTVEPPLP